MKEFSFGIIPYLFSDNGVSIMVSKSSASMDTFDFIKGKIEAGETEKECCKREVKEEIGIDIQIDDLETLVIQKNKKKNIGLYFINWDKYKTITPILCEREIYSLNWFNVSNIPPISKNQRLLITDINLKFNKLNLTNKTKDNI